MCRECSRQFVGNPADRPVSGEKKWIWLAPDIGTRDIVGVYILENAIKKVPKACGVHCLLFTVNVMQKFSCQGVISLQQKVAVKQIILIFLTLKCVRDFPGLSGKRFLFQKTWKIMPEPYGIS